MSDIFDSLNKLANVGQLNTTNDIIPVISGNSTTQEVLDYIFLSLCARVSVASLQLHGGYLMNKLLPNTSRATTDLDISICEKEQYNHIISTLKEIAEQMQSEGIISNYRYKETVSTECTGGVDLYRVNGKSKVGLDIGIRQEKFLTVYNINPIGDVLGFSIERMLCDKLRAVYSKTRLRRVKDLYDIYIIVTSFDIDMHKVKDVLHVEGTLDMEECPMKQVILEEYEVAYSKLRVEALYGTPTRRKPEFQECINVLRCVVDSIGTDKILSPTDWR